MTKKRVARAAELAELYPDPNTRLPFRRETYWDTDGGIPPVRGEKHHVVDREGNRITVDLPLTVVEDIVERCNTTYSLAFAQQSLSDWERDHLIAHIRIPINPTTKKTSNRVVRAGRYLKVLPSLQFERYEKAVLDLGRGIFVGRPRIRIPFAGPISFEAHYYRDSHRRVDIAGLHQAIQDILVEGGVIVDDRADILVNHDGSEVHYDKHNPRTELFIYSLTKKEDPGTS